MSKLPPQIEISPDVAGVVDAAQQAILDRPDLGLHQRGGALVRIIRDGARKVKGLVRPIGAPAIAIAPDAHILELMAKSADWCRYNEKEGKLKSALPPGWAVKVLGSRSEWPFPYLESVVETPVLRPDGTIVEAPGYDPSTAVWFDPGATTFPPVPSRPTIDDARGALKTLLEPFEEFPHVAESDRSAALAAVLSILGRPAIPGPVPLFAFRATAPGTGKSLEADVISTIGTGRVAARTTVPRDDDESRKRILAIGLEGMPVVLIDNVEVVLGSQSLSSALTGITWSDRLLGFSKTVTVCLRAVWLATGNNLSFKGDLGRRVVPCDLDANCEHPEDRIGFRHPDLLGHVRTERPKLVCAGLTLLRAFHVAGCPAHGKPPKGSYEDWDSMIRAAVIWVGCADPLSGCERIREDGDTDLDGLRQALNAWWQAFKGKAVTAAEAVRHSQRDEALRNALASFVGCDVTELSGKGLAYALRKRAKRVVSGMQFVKDGEDRSGAGLWNVARTGPSTAGVSAGDADDAGDVSRFAREDHKHWYKEGL